MKGLHSQNIIATVKYFPGNGDTFVDSHFGLPTVDKTLEQLKGVELRSFKELIDKNVDMIMTSHIEFPQIETKTVISKKDGKEIFLPATLSRTILTDLLRKQMGLE